MSILRTTALALSICATGALSYTVGQHNAPDAPAPTETVIYVDSITGETTQIDAIGASVAECNDMGGYYLPNDGERCEGVDF